MIIEEATNIQGHETKKNNINNEEVVKRFEELKKIRASSRSLAQKNEIQRLRMALNRASETELKRSHRLEKKR